MLRELRTWPNSLPGADTGRNDPDPSVDTGGVWDVLEEEIGKLSTKV